jgi:hypothetical protein
MTDGNTSMFNGKDIQLYILMAYLIEKTIKHFTVTNCKDVYCVFEVEHQSNWSVLILFKRSPEWDPLLNWVLPSVIH